MFLFVPLRVPTCRQENGEAEQGDEGATPDVWETGGARPAPCCGGVGCAEETIGRDTTVRTSYAERCHAPCLGRPSYHRHYKSRAARAALISIAVGGSTRDQFRVSGR